MMVYNFCCEDFRWNKKMKKKKHLLLNIIKLQPKIRFTNSIIFGVKYFQNHFYFFVEITVFLGVFFSSNSIVKNQVKISVEVRCYKEKVQSQSFYVYLCAVLILLLALLRLYSSLGIFNSFDGTVKSLTF